MKRKNVLFGVSICLAVALVTCSLLAGTQRRLHREAIAVQLDDQKPIVALTFDDGPNPRYTPQVLDVLYAHQAPATFFLVGENLRENELLVREMHASGHEIESHTFSHPDLTTLDAGQIQEEIRLSRDALREILPDYSLRYLRPPYGRYTQQVECASDLPLLLWTIDSGDWLHPDAQAIYTTVVTHVQDGDILVFHDDNDQTAQALERIIPELKARGFQFATVSQLLAARAA